MMLGGKTFQSNGEFDVARADNVLDLEVGEFGIEPKLLDDASIFAAGKLRIIFRLGARDDHLARCEDQGSGFGLTNTHDHSGETLSVVSTQGRAMMLQCG